MKKIIYIVLIIISTSLSAQKDTLYFATNWNKTVKANAAFFRPMPLTKVGDLYQVKDYHINGNLQMDGFYSDVEKETLEGKTIWYYENGQPLEILHHTNGQRNGESLYYLEKGFLRAKGIYKNNKKWSGTFVSELCYSGNAPIFKEGEKAGYLNYYSNSNQIATKLMYTNDSTRISTHYSPKGEKVGEFINIEYYTKTKDGSELSEHINYKDGLEVSYYKHDNCEVDGIKKYVNYRDGNLNGEELYFNREGKLLAKGINKDRMPWQGQFIKDYKKEILNYHNGVSHGKQTTYFSEEFKTVKSFYSMINGKKSGLEIAYNGSGKILKQQEYKDGKLNGLSKTMGAFEDKVCECEYKNGEPFTGDVCEDLFLEKYTEGQLTQTELYGEAPMNGLQTRILLKNGKKSQETNYHNDKKYELAFKDGEPYNGVEYNFSQKGSITYLNGEKHGVFINEYTSDYPVKVSGNYTNGNFDGEITYTNSALNKETTCTYIDGKPMNGTTMTDSYNTTYKAGKKHGLETSLKKITYGSTPYDSISRNYLMGDLDGKIEFYENNKLLATGVYKKNASYSGVFYEASTGTVDYINEYVEGILVRHKLIFNDIKQTTTYKNNEKHQTKFYNKEQLLAEGLYKNNQPYEGGFVVLEIKDPNYYHERYTLTHYKKGKKNGDEQLVNFKEDKIEKITTYRKNRKELKINFIPFKDSFSLVGVYKNGAPFSGYFLYEAHANKTFKNTISVLNHYENGQKAGHQFYAAKGSRMQNVIDSIAYVKGKPFQGVELEELDSGSILQHFYEKGKLTETRIHMFGVDDTPYGNIEYTANGFTTSSVYKKELVKEAEITYTNTDKTAGVAILYKNNIKIGSFKFSDDEITDVLLSYKQGNLQVDVRMNEPNILLIRIESTFELITLESKVNWSHTPKPIDFRKWEALFFKMEGTVKSYLKDKETLIGTCTYKEGEEYEGVITKVNENGTYTYRRYKNFERIAIQKDLTEEELIAILKE